MPINKNIWYKVRFNLRIYYMLEVIIIQYDIINFLNPLNRCSIFSFASCRNPLLAEVIVRGIFPAWKSLQTARLYLCPFWRMFPGTWLSTFSKIQQIISIAKLTVKHHLQSLSCLRGNLSFSRFFITFVANKKYRESLQTTFHLETQLHWSLMLARIWVWTLLTHLIDQL